MSEPSPPSVYGFGVRERQLYDLLMAASRKESVGAREKETWWLIERVYGKQGARSRHRFLARLRQLQRAVNRKLAQRGDQREIRQSRPGYRYLWNPARPLLPRRSTCKQLKPSRKKKQKSASRHYPSVRTCANLLLKCLQEDIHHSAELERRCLQIGCSWRCYRAARDRLGLRVVRRLVEGRWRWELYLPEDTPTAP
jgi:hypothetical protein